MTKHEFLMKWGGPFSRPDLRKQMEEDLRILIDEEIDNRLEEIDDCR